MSVSKPFDFETRGPLPDHQREAIEWLDEFKNTEALQDLLRKCRFSIEEIREYRQQWSRWLKPKKEIRKRMMRANGVH